MSQRFSDSPLPPPPPDGPRAGVEAQGADNRLTEIQDSLTRKLNVESKSLRHNYSKLRENRDKNFPSEKSAFKIPGPLIPSDADWMKFDWHLNGGLYTVNKAQIQSTINVLQEDIIKIEAERSKARGNFGMGKYVGEANYQRFKQAKDHLSNILTHVNDPKLPTYFYFPPFKLKCSGSFTFDMKTSTILKTSSTSKFSPSAISGRLKNLPKITQLFSDSPAQTIFKKENRPSQDIFLFNYDCEFLSCLGSCGIIKLNYLYIFPETRIGTANLSEQAFLLVDSDADASAAAIAKMGISFDKTDNANNFAIVQGDPLKNNLYTIENFSTAFNATIQAMIESNNYTTDQKTYLQEAMTSQDFKNPKTVLSENNQVRNELEVLYFFNDSLNFVRDDKDEEDNKDKDKIQKEKDALVLAGAQIFNRLNIDLRNNTGDMPNFDNFYSDEQQPELGEPLQNQISGFSGADELNLEGGFRKGGRGIGLPSFTKCTNPLFKRSNVVGKFLMNLRKRLRNKPMRRRKTKRNNKSKRRNKKSKRRQ